MQEEMRVRPEPVDGEVLLTVKSNPMIWWLEPGSAVFLLEKPHVFTSGQKRKKDNGVFQSRNPSVTGDGDSHDWRWQQKTRQRPQFLGGFLIWPIDDTNTAVFLAGILMGVHTRGRFTSSSSWDLGFPLLILRN